MNIKRIKETCLYVTDLDATTAFYAGKLGLPLLSKVPGRHVFFRAGETVLLCFIAGATQQELTYHRMVPKVVFILHLK